MTQEFNVGIRISNSGVDVGGVKVTREELDKLTTTQQKINNANAQMAQSSVAVKQATQAENEEFRKLDDELARLLSRLDPVYKKTQQLDSANDLLTRGMQAGLVTQTQYENALKNLEGGFEKAAEGAEHSMFATVGAKRELIVLGHEALTGNFSKMPGSFMVLGERMELTSALFSPMTLGILAVGGAAVVMAKAFADGEAEIHHWQNAIDVTNNYAGQTTSSMHALADSMTKSGTVTIGTAKQITQELVQSGQLGAQSIGSVAKLASDYAAATGKDVKKIAPDLIKLFEDPAKGAEELNKQMHFLSAADLEYISHLERIGNLEGAREVLSQKLEQHLPKQAEQLGTLQKAWLAVANAASSAWDKMLGIGRKDDIDTQIKEIENKLNARVGRGGQLAIPEQTGNTIRGVYMPSEREQLTKQLDDLKKQKVAEDDLAASRTKSATEEEKFIKAMDIANTSRLGQIQKLQDEIKDLNDALKPRGDNFASWKQQEKILDSIKNKQQEIARLEKADQPKPDRGLIKDENAYVKLTQQVTNYGDSLLHLDETNKKYTEGEKLLIKVQEDVANGMKKVSAADKEALVAKAQATVALEKYLEMQKLSIQAMWDQAAANEKEAAEYVKLEEKKQQAFMQGTEKLDLENQKLNANLITNDVDRAKKQLEIEHQHTLDVIDQMNYQEEQRQAYIDLETQNYDLQLKNIEKNSKDTKAASRELGLTFTSSLENIAVAGGSVSNVMAGLFQDIERVILRITVIQPMLKSLQETFDSSSIFSSIFGALGGTGGTGISALPDFVPAFEGALPSALGNAFNNGRLAFANGGAFTNNVVSSPTMFPLGLMGEKGPEAIMPLVRDASGSLGVKSSGGSSGNNVVVSIVVNADSSGKTQSGSGNSGDWNAFASGLESAVTQQVLKMMRPGGILAGKKA